MKKLFILFVLCFTNFIFAQSYTQKYNELYNRYDFFNNDGKLVGYKYYDDLNRVWKYKDLKEQSKTSYINPINTNAVNRALSSRQNAYNTNAERVQNVINKIKTEIQAFPEDDETKATMISRFLNETVRKVNSKNPDYSSNAVTTKVIDFLYEDAERIASEEEE